MGIIDSRDAQPVMAVLFDQEQMVVIVISVEEKAVVGQMPVPSGQARHFRTPDLLYALGGGILILGCILAVLLRRAILFSRSILFWKRILFCG